MSTYPLLTVDEATEVLLAADPSSTCPHCNGEGRLTRPKVLYEVIVRGAREIRSGDAVRADLAVADVIQWRPSETHGWVLWVFFLDRTGFGIPGLSNPFDDGDPDA